MSTLKRYRVDLGNSTDSPIGFVLRVSAPTPEAALEAIHDGLPEEAAVDPCQFEGSGTEEFDLRVYFNPAHIGLDDIEEEL